MRFLYCENDGSFGPAVQHCHRGFDFTVKFEIIVLEILPSAILTGLVVPRLYLLARKPPIVGGTWFQVLKLTSLLGLAILQLALAIIGSRAVQFRQSIIASTVLNLVASLSMGALSVFEHARDARPSIILNIYLPLTLLFDLASIRTFWLSSSGHDSAVFTGVFTAAVAVKAFIVLLEAKQKGHWISSQDAKRSPEETSGIYGLATCTWLARLLCTGYKVILKSQHLYPLEPSMSAEHLQQEALRLRLSAFNGKQFALAKSSILNYLSQPEGRPASSGYGLIGAAVFIYVGAPMSAVMQAYFHQRFLFKLRSVLVSAIFQKTTTVNVTAGDDKKALTLMSTDIQRIVLGFTSIHDLWAIPIQLAVTYYLLFRQIGPSFTASVIVTMLCIVASSSVMRTVGKLQKQWMEHVQARISKTANVISNIKSIKISGLGDATETAIQKMRVNEISIGNKFRSLLMLNITLGFTPGQLSPMFTFVTAMRDLSVTAIFTSMSLLALAGGKLNVLIQKAPYLMASLACFQRIQEFLEQKGQHDFREQKMSDAETTGDPGSQRGNYSSSISIRDGCFGWEDGKYIVKNVSAEIEPGLTIVAGPVACGKSTLCKALLGETVFNRGHILLDMDCSKIGFCDQTPFLLNATIRENIAGKGDVDEVRYEEILKATMLHIDLLLLPQGDETMVGSNGAALSGGQKQRVSIARALYERCQLNVFDDVLSGLDRDTEQQVFNRVFGPFGLLRKRKTTTVLCTHSIRHLPLATHIIVLSQEGTVAEQGTFSALRSNDNYVQSLGLTRRDRGNDSENDETSQGSTLKLAERRPQRTAADAKSRDATRTRGDRKVFVHYFGSIGICWLAMLVLMGVVCGFFWNFPNVWLKLWSEDTARADSLHGISYWLGIYSAFAMLSLLAITAEVSIGMLAVAKVTGTKLHSDALRTVMAAPLRLFATTDMGVITNLFSQDMSLVDEELPVSLLEAVIMMWIVIGAAAVTATVSPYVLIAYPFIFAAVYFIQRFYLRTSRQLRLLDLEAKSPLYTHFFDTMKGIATFRAFGWTDRAVTLNRILLDSSIRPDFQLKMIQSWLSFVLGMLVAVLAVTIVILATQLKAESGLTGASMVAIISFGGYLSSIIVNYTLLETSIGAVNRLKTFSDKTLVEDSAQHGKTLPASWPDTGHVILQGISTSYDKPRGDTANIGSPKPTLKNVSLEIMPREKVAICGRTGSGKSSLVLLLLRLLDPIPGAIHTISIDGISLADIDGNVVRQRVIAIAQDAVFLPDGASFRMNLDPNGKGSDDICQQSLQVTGMLTYVLEHGGLGGELTADELSQGQKQLFVLSRAIVRRRMRALARHADAGDVLALAPPNAIGLDTCARDDHGGMLILDEYNSSVDAATDKRMQDIIAQEFKHYTVIMISHRLETVLRFDKVVVLDSGRVVEQGVPEALLKQDGSRFKELWVSGGN
ncbi:hypothetical protein LMH87_002148 [Akanthomyces muscarius]|uniref:ABC transporter n=1 Tax=Akanthomyces muscarius TaxID=2231603 RepID=A0A9W8UIY8_AKAMU|nr:hypothetical protein LMH87_002148 [Akanthomyces muscarius]KAJ4147637.1 hypothetical protein LMH87_002148 [Akanthomyces muscarius]